MRCAHYNCSDVESDSIENPFIFSHVCIKMILFKQIRNRSTTKYNIENE